MEDIWQISDPPGRVLNEFLTDVQMKVHVPKKTDHIDGHGVVGQKHYHFQRKCYHEKVIDVSCH